MANVLFGVLCVGRMQDAPQEILVGRVVGVEVAFLHTCPITDYDHRNGDNKKCKLYNCIYISDGHRK